MNFVITDWSPCANRTPPEGLTYTVSGIEYGTQMNRSTVLSITKMAARDGRTRSINAAVLHSEFVQQPADSPLRICCYGSSSSETPEAYLSEARSLGYILGKRGHTCVNGAGAYGCMAAMNDGCHLADGNMVGVIHEMWLSKSDTLRDGGAHPAFVSTENAPKTSTTTSKGPVPHGSYLENSGKRQILVAGGKDLQEVSVLVGLPRSSMLTNK